MNCLACGPYAPCDAHSNPELAVALRQAMTEHAAEALAEARQTSPDALGHLCDARCAEALAAKMGA